MNARDEGEAPYVALPGSEVERFWLHVCTDRAGNIVGATFYQVSPWATHWTSFDWHGEPFDQIEDVLLAYRRWIAGRPGQLQAL